MIGPSIAGLAVVQGWGGAALTICLTLVNLTLFSFTPARAASLDMATSSCQDWIDNTDDEQDQVVAWLRGYLAGRSSASLYNPEAARSDRTSLKIYCQQHLTTGVISAASQSLR